MENILNVRVPSELKAKVEKAAKASGQDVSGFVRGVLDIVTDFSDEKLKANLDLLHRTEKVNKDAEKAYKVQRERYKDLMAGTMAYSIAGRSAGVN